MTAEPSNPVTGWDCVQGALADVRSVHGEFQTFFAGMLDELESLCEVVLTEELQRDRCERVAEHETVQAQISRLNALAAELSSALKEQKQLARNERKQWTEEIKCMRVQLRTLQDTA